MAFTWSVPLTGGHTVSGGTFVNTSSFTTTAGSLVYIVIRTEADVVSAGDLFNPVGSPVTNVNYVRSTGPSGIVNVRVALYSAEGTGNTGTMSQGYEGSGISFTGGVTDNQQIEVYQAVQAGVTSNTVIQSNGASATSSTATVTLDDPVVPGNECLYIGHWTDYTDVATPGTGWTELSDTSTLSPMYAQYHSSPTGAQSGQVSAIASQANCSMIIEIENTQNRGGGWGTVGIF